LILAIFPLFTESNDCNQAFHAMNMNPQQRLAKIQSDISTQKGLLDKLAQVRGASRSLPQRLTTPHQMLLTAGLAPKSYKLVAQGDSWFDYLPGWDLIDWLKSAHGHDIDDIGVAGSTLNDIVYGLVPVNWLGVAQSDDVDRLTELIHRIDQIRPDAVLLSGGGNDIAGPEFFSFVNNAVSNLKNPNAEVLDGVVNQTFAKAYADLVGLINAQAQQMGYSLPIFVHGYDYPWPDGRGLTMFNLVGPWFNDTFNKKNYPYNGDATTLQVRHDIVAAFIDSFNKMLAGLAANYPGVVNYVDLRGTLQTKDDWANELHPNNDGFGKLADKINLALHTVLP
jgi:lysophospholipase L1-like esterase